jgi:hypothetical protein
MEDRSTALNTVDGPTSSVAPAPGEVRPEAPSGAGEDRPESVRQPAKVVRIGAMVEELLSEMHQGTLDEASRRRIRTIYERSLDELSSALSPDLAEELRRQLHPFVVDPPSGPEMRVAQAQLAGWLDGLFQGMRAAAITENLRAVIMHELSEGERQGETPLDTTPARIVPEGEAADGGSPPGAYL